MMSTINPPLMADPNKTSAYSTTYASTSTDPDKMVGVTFEDFDPTYGARQWRFVRNASGSTLVAKKIAIFTTGQRILVGAATTTQVDAARVAGVPLVDIPTGYYGWVQTKGQASVTADSTGFAADASLVNSTADAATFMTSPNTTAGAKAIIGIALAAIAANATGVVYLTIPE